MKVGGLGLGHVARLTPRQTDVITLPRPAAREREKEKEKKATRMNSSANPRKTGSVGLEMSWQIELAALFTYLFTYQLICSP